jgi:plastocyanin
VTPRRRTRSAATAVFGAVALLLAGCTAAPAEAGASSGGASSDGAGTASTAPQENTAEAAVTAVAPAELSVSGGTTVTIEGSGLSDATSVTFNGTPGTNLAVASDTSLTVVAPRATDFQPAAADVQVLQGDTPVSSTAAPVSYTVQTPVDKQLTYALAHWNNYNVAEYGNMNPIGGDCVNFVSQTLIQRGWEMTDEWHNRSGGAEWTSAWIHVPTFDRWLRANQQELGITPLTLEQRDQVKPGDIVVFDWNLNDSLDHTQIVSAVEVVDGKQKILMAGHNLDHNFRDFDNTITVEHPGAHAAFWSVP